MVLLICPSSSSVVRCPSSSVNFCFKSLLLLYFLFDNSEIFTGETVHIVPPCNKARISNFCLEFQEFQEFQISVKRYSSLNSYLIILIFFTRKSGYIVPPCTKAGISNFHPGIPRIPRIRDFFETLLLEFLFDHSEFFTRETRHIMPHCNKARISNFCLEETHISFRCYSSLSSYLIIPIFFYQRN